MKIKIPMSSEVRRRSRSYPSAILSECIENIRKLSSKLGPGPFSREDMAKQLGYAGLNGTSARRIASLGMYGLTEGRGEEIALSDLARRLLRPLPGEESVVLRDSFFSVDLFKEVFDDYGDHGRLPDALPVVLERKYGIATEVGDTVAKILRESGQFAGVLEADGKIKGSQQDQSPGTEAKQQNVVVETPYSPNTFANADAAGVVTHRLPRSLTSFTHSERLTPEEIKRTLDWIDRVIRPALEFSEVEGEKTD